MQSRQSDRLSFNQSQTSPQQIFKGINSIAYMSFGSQSAQLEKFHQKFVKEYKWLSQTQLKQIQNLCWALPGPTVIQVIITTTTLKTKSILNGIIAFIIFCTPSWITLAFLGWFSKELPQYQDLPTQVKLMFLGFISAAAGIMFRGFFFNFIPHAKKPQTLFIILVSATVFVIFRSTASISFCLLFGAILSLYTEIQTKKKMSQKSAQLMRNTSFSFILGKTSIYLLIFIYLLMWVYFSIYSNSKYIYIFIDYFVGCFIIGPVNTVFPYFYANFLDLGVISQNHIWLGVALAYMLPGSVINVGIYYGSIIDGFKGAVISAIFLYLPCFLSIYGILPSWKYYRDKPGVQRLIIGITCVTTGLVLGTIILSIQHCVKIDLSSTLCLFLLSLFLNTVCGIYSVFTVLICGFLANSRRWGLIYYRMVADHSY